MKKIYIRAKGDSMLPTIKNNDTLLLENISEEELRVGDVIVFVADGVNICHRIIKIIKTKNSKLFFETKGDNCEYKDSYAVTKDMIIGRIEFRK